jgi:glycosyltransferase involved in cell wall biosynthesis
MQDTAVTVVLPARGGIDHLPVALAHLEVQSFPSARFEVIVARYGAQVGVQPDRAVLERYISGAPIPVRLLAGPFSTRGQACNAAIRESRGRVLLFLDEDLLASPTLVEVHAELHDHLGASCAVIGRIDSHPQTDPRAFTRPWQDVERSRARIEANAPYGFLNWRLAHISYPRQLLVDSGGFDESAELASLEDIELSFKLERQGVQGKFSNEAVAMAWRTVSVEDIRRRHYLEGYALRTLEQRTGETKLVDRLHRHATVQPFVVRKLYAPLFAALCPLFASNTPLFRFLMERVSLYDTLSGYRDARSGLSPAPPHVSPAHAA